MDGGETTDQRGWSRDENNRRWSWSNGEVDLAGRRGQAELGWKSSGVFSYVSKPTERNQSSLCSCILSVTMDIEVTAEAVGSVPGHSKFGGMPGLAGLVQELAQFKSAPRIFLASNAGNHPILTMAQIQISSWHTIRKLRRHQFWKLVYY